MAKRYQHFCPIARALEKIGDKWSLLIIRDLLRGPQRFTDLMGYLSNITPKWLTLRLRDLEAAGIVERESRAGRREVYYTLTPAGQALAPEMEELFAWGMKYAMRPPFPGEVIHPDLLMMALTVSLNRRGKVLRAPTTWKFQFPQVDYLLTFDGVVWKSSLADDEDAAVRIKTTPEAWATLSTLPRSARREALGKMVIEGELRRWPNL